MVNKFNKLMKEGLVKRFPNPGHDKILWIETETRNNTIYLK